MLSLKSILREAFKSNNIGFSLDLHDTSGELGLPPEWNTNRQTVENWISYNGDRIDEIIALYTAQFNTSDCDISYDIDTLKNWAKGTFHPCLIDEVSTIANRPTYADGLAQCLAEGGLLPMYGMPSDSRTFYHGFNRDPKIMDLREIDRSAEMAITEFAPGSEKTKDKGKYRVEGISTSLRYEKARGRNPECIVSMNPSDVDALHNCYTMHIDPNSMQDISTWRIEDIRVNEEILTPKEEVAHNLQANEKC